MSLEKVFGITSSGMFAQSARLNTVASNIANADSISSSDNKVYKARKPVFAATMADYRQETFAKEVNPVGVKLLGIVESKTPAKMEYMPDHPQANEQGMIFKSNVNPMEEMADMIEASRAFQLNVEMTETVKGLMQSTIRMGKN